MLGAGLDVCLGDDAFGYRAHGDDYFRGVGVDKVPGGFAAYTNVRADYDYGAACEKRC